MAKQSGLHQLRGKVGEHSYYRQTGISSGLVRSINQGMSSRVKNDEAFVNTRLNNAEFGQAGRIASVLGQYISPKFRPMILPFSQSKMAKVILEYIKTDTTHPWGERNIVSDNSVESQVAALNSVAKNRLEDFGLDLVFDEENTELTISITDETINKLAAIGANGLAYRFVATSTWIGNFVESADKYFHSIRAGMYYDGDFNDPTTDDEVTIKYALHPSPPQTWPVLVAGRMGIFIVMPFRTIGDTRHTLQEYCTFKAFAIADGPVN